MSDQTCPRCRRPVPVLGTDTPAALAGSVCDLEDACIAAQRAWALPPVNIIVLPPPSERGFDWFVRDALNPSIVYFAQSNEHLATLASEAEARAAGEAWCRRNYRRIAE